MKSIKKWNIVVIAVLLIMTVGLFLVMAGGGAEKIVLKLAHNGPSNHPFQLACMKFQEILEKEAPGQFDVQIFPSEQLGTEQNCAELVKTGSIAGSVSSCLQFVPEADIFNFPFLFPLSFGLPISRFPS